MSTGCRCARWNAARLTGEVRTQLVGYLDGPLAGADADRVAVEGRGFAVARTRELVGHAGARRLADLADTTGLTGGFGDALAGLRQRQGGHDPGRVAVDVAVMIADGGVAIAYLAVLRDQAELFGAVASDPTRVAGAIWCGQ